jgi:hypothetical protein
MIDLSLLRADLSREDVIQLLGQPDDIGGTSRKYPTPRIYKYGDIELHFTPYKNGRLVFAMNSQSHQKIWE